MSYILWGILLYLLYRFITGFIWPVYKATSHVKKQFRNMQESMRMQEQDPENPSGANQEKPKFDIGGEYIPFEEIKPSR